MAELLNPELDRILEGTSRSFYLSLGNLPKKIRSQVGLLYLLARTSDTIADSERGSSADRLAWLKQYGDFLQGIKEDLPDLRELSAIQRNPAEARLLEVVDSSVACVDRFSDEDQVRIRHCLSIIISGQTLDLERFADANPENMVSLQDDSELDDYAYRVAGSVGEFWTSVSLGHLFDLDEEKENRMYELAIRFGKALQMINILRDIPEDLAMGRCYIPATALSEFGLTPSDLLDQGNMGRFRPLYSRYLDLTVGHLEAAIEYIEMLPHSQFRLRGACMLPVMIAYRTLRELREGNVLDPAQRIKVSRREIKKVLKKVAIAIPIPGLSSKLLDRARKSGSS
ncbi:MAG: phytoene/squalene synthase family protein [Candidatus Thermoplasmatota archaeon]|nr:phytoene/squalene synthase family protein [Candidatus Thermoplasmatota archaeon]MEE3269612.1 phytoene/squalene synthase family protein [Candidatus Thermoplasmatota archaeon]